MIIKSLNDIFYFTFWTLHLMAQATCVFLYNHHQSASEKRDRSDSCVF